MLSRELLQAVQAAASRISCAAADILKGKSIGSDEFTLSVYPASTPIYAELARNGTDLQTL